MIFSQIIIFIHSPPAHFFVLIMMPAVFMYNSCKKDNNILAETPLINKSEAEIRSLMTGRWKIHYSKSYQGTNVCSECYWDITSSDTLTETYNGTFFSKTRIKYERTTGTNEWIMMNYSGVGTVSNILKSLKKDTLISTYSGTTTVSYLTKQ